jgi:DNA-binding response OmpR family regulator
METGVAHADVIRRDPAVNPSPDVPAFRGKLTILHTCQREMLRPLRDRILRISGFEVDSTLSHAEALSLFERRTYNLVLIDVEGEGNIESAEHLCAAVKTAQPKQQVAFVCNWRVAALTDCPDEIVRTEFNPESFVAGVRKIVENLEAEVLETGHLETGEGASKSGQGTLS